MISSFILLGVVVYLIYRFYVSKYSYWADRGFVQLKPTPPFGSLKELVLFQEFQGYSIQKFYNELGEKPYGGFYLGRRPVLLVKDPEIIKCILIKDFSSFRDRRIDPKIKTSILSRHLFVISGSAWKPLRVKLTPTFTTGKLKMMFPLFQSCSEVLESCLSEKAHSKSTIDVKDVMADFTTDIIGSCAFGIEMGAMGDTNNKFRELGKQIFPNGVRLERKIPVWLNMVFPGLRYIYRSRFIPQKYEDFIISFVKDTIKYREENKITRNDFLNLLIELKNQGNIESSEKEGKDSAGLEMTEELLIAQCFVFFAAGFETSSSVMSYSFYEMAVNPEIQEKVRKEVDEVSRRHGGITYQALQEMSYLTQVVEETMRKYPTLPQLDRICTKTYKLPDSGLVINEGTGILIPTYSIHHDPKYYPDPEKFDPERFSLEGKPNIPHCTYFPFGEGPRICIGMRFGFLQVKMGIATVLSKFILKTTKETQIPLRLIPSLAITSVDGPILLQISRRQNENERVK